jgi:hypothetical protein
MLLKKYGKRWGIECSFRDTKDPHFGMGMAQIRINSPERRDRFDLDKDDEGSAFLERSWTMESDRRPSRSLVIWSSVANR